MVQYEESDWDFVQRWLEREGLFYWFEQDESQKGERLVISEQNPGVPEWERKCRYASHNLNSDPNDPYPISHWEVRRRRTPARVALLDSTIERPPTS